MKAKNSKYAHIEDIFNDYKDDFYKYLVPWVVDYLRNNEIEIKISGIKRYKGFASNYFSNYLKPTIQIQKIIDNAIKKYFDYMFPDETFPYIDIGTVNKVIEPIDKNEWTLVRTHKKHIFNQVYIHGMRFYKEIFEYVRVSLKGHEIDEDKGTYDNYEFEVEKLRENILLNPLMKIIEEKLTNKTLTSYNEFIKEERIKNLHLSDDLLKKGYRNYENRWKQKKKDEELDNKPHTKRPSNMNAKQYILSYIIPDEKPENEPKKYEEIDDITIEYRKSDETPEDIYNYYIKLRNEKFNRLKQRQIINISDEIKYCGYKSPDKIRALNKLGKNEKILLKRDYTTNYFPLKENLKKYSLHTIAPKDSYIIDLMFENRIYCYLVAININTRKLWVEPTNIERKNDNETNKSIKAMNKEIKAINDNQEINEEFKEKLIEEKIIKQMKNSKLYIKALDVLISDGMKVKYLKGDGERAFNSNQAQQFYFIHGINKNKPNEKKDKQNEFIEVNRQKTKYPEFMKDLNMVKSIKSEPTHSSLGIIDRVIRTIREIAFNLGWGVITPSRMKYIVDLYNNAPHNTLSKYAGKPVSPNDVDEELERFIVRRIQQENYNISSKFDYNLLPGEEVVIYNERNNMAKRRSEIEPGKWFVVENVGNKYKVVDENGKNEQIKSRYKLHPKGMSKLPF